MIKSVYNKKFNFSHERQFNKFFGTIKILISPPTFKMNKKIQKNKLSASWQDQRSNVG